LIILENEDTFFDEMIIEMIVEIVSRVGSTETEKHIVLTDSHGGGRVVVASRRHEFQDENERSNVSQVNLASL